jgi:hypothetical protein
MPVVFWPWIREFFGVSHRITVVCAFAISFFIYALIKKKLLLGIVMLIICGIVFVQYNSHFHFDKNQRINVNRELLRQIKQHPFVGSGFYNGMNPAHMFPVADCVHQEPDGRISNKGWVYRHNDFLSIAAYLGLPALALIALTIIGMMYLLGGGIPVFVLLGFIITCGLQMTMFTIDKAISILLFTAWAIARKKEETNESYH